MALALLSLGAIGALEACSLFFDDDGLTSRPAVAAESGTLDAGQGNSEPADKDGSAGSDGGSCDGAFCENFDQGALGASWSGIERRPGGSLDLGSPATSPPNALRARVTPVESSPSAFLHRNLGAGTRVACEFSAYVAGSPTTNFVDLFSIQTTTPDFGFELWFGFSRETTTFREDFFLADGGCDCPLTDHHPPVPAFGSWVRVRVETDFRSASLQFDGTTMYSGAIGGFTPTGPISIWLGIRGYPQQSAEVMLDDLVCSIRP